MTGSEATYRASLQLERTDTQVNFTVISAATLRSPWRIVTGAGRHSRFVPSATPSWADRSVQAILKAAPDSADPPWVISIGLRRSEQGPLPLDAADLAEALDWYPPAMAGLILHRPRTNGQTARTWTLLRREVNGHSLAETYFAAQVINPAALTLALHHAVHEHPELVTPRLPDRVLVQGLHDAVDRALQRQPRLDRPA